MNIDHVRAQTHIHQLQNSDRGQAALRCLTKLLSHESTRSLDQQNQMALTHLLAYSLAQPYIRDMVQIAVTKKPAPGEGAPQMTH